MHAYMHALHNNGGRRRVGGWWGRWNDLAGQDKGGTLEHHQPEPFRQLECVLRNLGNHDARAFGNGGWRVPRRSTNDTLPHFFDSLDFRRAFFTAQSKLPESRPGSKIIRLKN